jgi:hypothetical protein
MCVNAKVAEPEHEVSVAAPRLERSTRAIEEYAA